MLEFLQGVDEKIILAVNGWNSPFFDSIMWWISGKFSWWPLYLVLMVLIFAKRNWKDSLLILFMIILLIVLSDQSSVHFFKNTIQRLRPSHNPHISSQLHFVNNYMGGQFGFISSHAANCFGIAIFLSLVFRKKVLSFILLFWATIVIYSRMYLGVHYFLDVLAGAIWGSVLGYLIYLLYLKMKNLFNKTESESSL